MRLRIALALGVTAAALASSGAVAAHAHADEGAAHFAEPFRAAPDERPSCGDPASSDFPITTRLRGGPDTYRAGGAAGEWSLELTNTTGKSCRNIHPVIVLMDRERELDSGQVELEFQDGAGRWIDVPFHTTDEDEHIGVFDGGFPGFTVAADRTVTVKVRLAFDSDTAPARAVANAAVVQRQRDDGEWVGESNDYRFTITGRGGDRDTGHDTDTDTDTDTDRDPDPDRSPAPEHDPAPDITLDDGTPRIREHPHALAMTGRDPGPLLALGATAGALLLAGGALVAGSRRLRAPQRRE
ncbi:hypothetical protein [Streptomyces flavidovirens]|uniref:hypothetical protein n=1 Tax=Streptomyces flavidovirens TaxID=67298 RepID=UPI000411167D|nr:hypothetical protein [Streptomyces flavidovirens]